MFSNDEIRRSRRSLKRRREDLHANIVWAMETKNFAAGRQAMLDAGYEDEDPEMQRFLEVWEKKIGPTS